MGNICATDIYRDVKEANPQTFEKFIVGEEIKNNIKDRSAQAQTKLNNAVAEIKKQNLAAIAQKEKQVQDHYESVKEQVDRHYLGGIKGLQQANNNATIDQIFSYQAIQQKFQIIKQESEAKIDKAQKEAQHQFNTVASEQIERVSKEQPKLEYFDQLAAKLKSEVINSGVKEYKEKIESQSKVLLAPLDKKLSVDTFTDKAKELIPADTLKSTAHRSKETLDEQLRNLIGRPSEVCAVLQ